MKKGLLLAALFVSTTTLAEGEDRYGLLSSMRSSITYPEFSLEDKRVVIDQARLTLDQLFVHRYTKRDTFGPSVDHGPRLDALAARMGTLSSTEFHTAMANVFFKLNDAHTQYRYPAPHACYRTFLPVDFKEVAIADNQKVIALSNFVDKPEVQSIWSNTQNLRIGDVLRAIDGVPVYQVLEQLKPISMGANPEAVNRLAGSLLSFRSHRYYPVPVNDSVALTLQKQDGSTVVVTLPWLTVGIDECLNPNPNNPIPMGESFLVEKSRLIRKRVNRQKGAGGWTATSEPILKWRTVRNAHGLFGVLRLDSFVPEENSPEEVVDLVISLLRGPLANTDGLIWDLRHNGGGFIDLAHSLMELFTPQDIVPLDFRLLNSAANQHYWNKFANDPFTATLNDIRGTDAVYTRAIPMIPTARINSRGQFYFAPVALLTNAACYSSCDMFSALMQDHAAATIFGEDSTTGAGGANNYFHQSLTAQLGGDLGPFAVIPAGGNIGFSFRQSIRVKSHAGELIEDVGVRSDRIAAPTLTDLTSESSAQMATIGAFLKTSAGPRSFFDGADTLSIQVGTRGEWPIRWRNVTRLQMNDSNRGALAGGSLPEAQGSAPLNLPAELGQQIGHGTLQVRGFNGDALVARKVVEYRVVPAPIQIAQGAGFSVDFNDMLTNPLMIHNYDNPATDGWRVLNGVLRIGDGMLYKGNVDTYASLFVTLPTEGNLSLRLEYDVDTEKACDFFSASLITKTGEQRLVVPVSGLASESKLVSLAAHKGKTVEIRLSFFSDTYEVSRGVTVRKLEIVPAPL